MIEEYQRYAGYPDPFEGIEWPKRPEPGPLPFSPLMAAIGYFLMAYVGLTELVMLVILLKAIFP